MNSKEFVWSFGGYEDDVRSGAIYEDSVSELLELLDVVDDTTLLAIMLFGVRHDPAARVVMNLSGDC